MRYARLRGRGSLLRKDMQFVLCAPHGGLREPFPSLPLPENVKVSAGTEFRQQTRPLRRLQRRVQRRQKRMLQHFQNFPFCPRPPFLIPARKLPLIHHLSSENNASGPRSGGRRRRRRMFELSEVYRADVAGAETVEEADIGE